MTEQDEGLEKLEETVISTKHIALAVNEELDLHTRLIVLFFFLLFNFLALSFPSLIIMIYCIQYLCFLSHSQVVVLLHRMTWTIMWKLQTLVSG